MLRRKFAVIKFWPEAQAAEDELIARLRLASISLNLECLVVDSFARLIDPPGTQLTRDDVDFVLSLHFEAPKQYDIFSFVTLWNPVQFYHERGYRKHTRHLLTHDDFLSCDSVSGDDHVMRSVSTDPMRDRPYFRFYPTVSGPIFKPTLGDKKLFYAGINWERSANKPGRHAELLGLVDGGEDLRIYGPKLFAGVDVWNGYKSYVGPIPFDGVSVIRLINRAGIALVLSSEAHRQAEMMSCRIFESLAAGAVVICDENAFARRHFGDTLLYIDTSLPPTETYSQIESHLDWIKSQPAKALEMAKLAQEIFCANFKLDTFLEKIYAELPERKQRLECLYTPKRPEERICVVFLLPEFRPELLERHIASCLAQRNVRLRAILAMDTWDVEVFGRRVRTRLNELAVPFEVEAVPFMERFPNGSLRRRRPVGEAIGKVIGNLVREDYVSVVAPQERLFADHFSSLLRTLQDSPDDGSAWSDRLLLPRSGNRGDAKLDDRPDVNGTAEERPIGFGRFLFRMSALEARLQTALPYLDSLAMHLLFGTTRSRPTRRCTLMASASDASQTQAGGVPAELEREILIDYSPDLFRKIQSGHAETLPPQVPSFEKLSSEEKTKMAVELAHSIPVPPLLKKIAFGAYRSWFRTHANREPEDRDRSE